MTSDTKKLHELGPLDGLLLEAVEAGFTKLAAECPHRVTDQRGEHVCAFSDSAPSDCCLEFCPRIRAKLRGVKNDNP